MAPLIFGNPKPYRPETLDPLHLTYPLYIPHTSPEPWGSESISTTHFGPYENYKQHPLWALNVNTTLGSQGKSTPDEIPNMQRFADAGVSSS